MTKYQILKSNQIVLCICDGNITDVDINDYFSCFNINNLFIWDF